MKHNSAPPPPEPDKRITPRAYPGGYGWRDTYNVAWGFMLIFILVMLFALVMELLF